MPTLIFEGYSDDNFIEYGVTRDGYDNGACGEPIRWLVTAGGEGLVVVGHHHGNGPLAGWLVGVMTYDPDHEDRPLPSWPMRLLPSSRTPYSPQLQVDVPDDFRLSCMERGEPTP